MKKKREFTINEYNNYMLVVKENIRQTELRMEGLDKMKKISELSFEDFVRFQNGELKI